MKELEPNDKRHLDAAEGWLGLGNYPEATEELERITPEGRDHPVVLQARYQLFAAADDWKMAAEIARSLCTSASGNPFGFLYLADALHEMKQTQEAWDVLLEAAEKFVGEYAIWYNLARYACHLRRRQEALVWLKKAFELNDSKEAKLLALDDPDLELLWTDIAEI